MKIKIEKFNCEKLTDLINRVKMVNPSLFLVFTKEGIKTRVLENRVFVKMITMGWDNFVPEVEKVQKQFTEDVYLAFDKAANMLETIKHFVGTDTNLVIDTTEYDDKVYGSKVNFKNAKMSVNVGCRDPRLDFLYLTDSQMLRVMDLSGSSFEFELSSEDFKQIKNTMKLSNQNYFTLRKEGNKIWFHKGTDLKMLIDEYSESGENGFVNALDSYFNYCDTDMYKVTVCAEENKGKVVLESMTNDCKVFFSIRKSTDDDDNTQDMLIDEFIND